MAALQGWLALGQCMKPVLQDDEAFTVDALGILNS
jgi:hypothetical protein